MVVRRLVRRRRVMSCEVISYLILSMDRDSNIYSQAAGDAQALRKAMELYTDPYPVKVFQVGIGADGGPVLVPVKVETEVITKPRLRRSVTI